MTTGKTDLPKPTGAFWEDIHRYIEDQKYEIETSRQKIRKHPRKCPDCSSQMIEENFHKVLIDRCHDCGGVYLDKGELEILFKSNQTSGFLPSLKSFLEN